MFCSPPYNALVDCTPRASDLFCLFCNNGQGRLEEELGKCPPPLEQQVVYRVVDTVNNWVHLEDRLVGVQYVQAPSYLLSFWPCWIVRYEV